MDFSIHNMKSLSAENSELCENRVEGKHIYAV